MTTYYAAQFAITLSIVKARKSEKYSLNENKTQTINISIESKKFK